MKLIKNNIVITIIFIIYIILFIIYIIKEVKGMLKKMSLCKF